MTTEKRTRVIIAFLLHVSRRRIPFSEVEVREREREK